MDANVEAWQAFTASVDLEEVQVERWGRGPKHLAIATARGERFGTRRHAHMLFVHEMNAQRFRLAVDAEAARLRNVFRFTEGQLAVAMRVLEAAERAAAGVVGPSEPVSPSRMSEYQSDSSQAVTGPSGELVSTVGKAA
jgi:hypothetical protein